MLVIRRAHICRICSAASIRFVLILRSAQLLLNQAPSHSPRCSEYCERRLFPQFVAQIPLHIHHHWSTCMKIHSEGKEVLNCPCSRLRTHLHQSLAPQDQQVEEGVNRQMIRPHFAHLCLYRICHQAPLLHQSLSLVLPKMNDRQVGEELSHRTTRLHVLCYQEVTNCHLCHHHKVRITAFGPSHVRRL